MSKLATLATVNGVLAGYSYGDTPNDPNTWDAFKIFGCFCDAKYEGYDCSQNVCPKGDDPLTVHQVDEAQIISCTDSDMIGNVIFTFRQGVSVAVSVTASVTDVKNALQAIPTVGLVAVETVIVTNPNTLCTPAGNQFLVTFLTTHGALPLMQLASNYIDLITISENVQGTKEHDTCSGRGLCDPTTGLCTCFLGFSSSDGMGNQGILGDCGYTIP